MHIQHKSTQFSNSLLVLLFILITYISWCNAITDDEVREAVRSFEAERNNPVRYCGRRLNNMMKFVCKREVRDLTKDADFQIYNDRIDNYESEDDMIKSRYKTTEFEDLLPFNDFGRSQNRNRKRRGIIDECCRNPCSWTSLIKYCPMSG